MEFKDLHTYTRTWFMSCLAAHPNEKIEALIKQHVEGAGKVEHIETPADDAFFVSTPASNYFTFRGTKNWLGWLTDFAGWTWEGFHWGIWSSVKNEYKSKLLDLSRKDDRPFLISGQSRGGLECLFANLIVREAGRKAHIESVGYSGPYGANKKGVDRLKSAKVCHTRVFSDSNTTFPSDPVDNIGCVYGKHYGYPVNLYGSSSGFDHSYRATTKGLMCYFGKKNMWDDWKFLNMMLDTGVAIK